MNQFIRRVSVRRFTRKEQGSVILETALMLTILLMFAFGIVDFGRVMYVSNALTSATRDAARWAAVQPTAPTAAVVAETIKVHFNSFTFGGPTLVPGNVSMPVIACQVAITTTYPFNWLTPLPRLMGWSNSSTPMTSNIHARAIYKYEWNSSC